MTTWQERAAAETFLAKKLREYVAQCQVPALGAVLVRDAGSTIEPDNKASARWVQAAMRISFVIPTGSISVPSRRLWQRMWSEQ